ncbi:MAG: hypothetical protein QM809_11340 [Gordonia sp. (in: high G+C Gram-positive bacteria)]|uniref:hypothetical protein n=1 Tax=Gordonia sp. (in: high G+C Gram-positive bacteria) TaxID=84139 RepID=UPI0039E4DFB7
MKITRLYKGHQLTAETTSVVVDHEVLAAAAERMCRRVEDERLDLLWLGRMCAEHMRATGGAGVAQAVWGDPLVSVFPADFARAERSRLARMEATQDYTGLSEMAGAVS